MQKLLNDFDSAAEEAADAARKSYDAGREAMLRKIAAEKAKHAAGVGVYSAEELAAQEAEDDEGEDA